MKFITTKNREYSMLWLNADGVTPHVLQHAKNTAIGLLQLGARFDEAFAQFPYDIDEGWADIDPQDDHVTFAQMIPGLSFEARLDGINAVAVGSNQVKRVRGAALALVVASAVNHPTIITPEMLQEYHELSLMVEAAKQSVHELQRVEVEPKTAARRAETGSTGSGRRLSEVQLAQKVDDLCRDNLELLKENEKLRRALDKVVQIATNSTQSS